MTSMRNITPQTIATGVSVALAWAVLSYLVGGLTVVDAVLVGLVMGVLCAGVWVAMDRVMSRKQHQAWQSRS